MTVTYGLLSTFPPTACGLATFTAALGAGLTGSAARPGACRVVRVVDEPGDLVPGVVANLVAGSAISRRDAADELNDTDVVIIQHEYGIFGGPDGDEILAVMDALTKPVIVVLHTVVVEPTAHQREVLEAVVEAADAAVTMTHTAARRLAAGYSVDMDKISVIPHGAHVTVGAAPVTAALDARAGARPTGPAWRPTILTWGLIGPGKGIEWGIEALALLGDLRPSPRYLVVGETHPRVFEAHGEAYRTSLRSRADGLGLSDDVVFDATYLDVPALQRIVEEATLVLLPYDSPDQITSGVLIEAVAAGKPVVSTRFPHAVELLGGGVGLLVAHRDPADIAAAVRRVLTDGRLRANMTGAAQRLAPGLAWAAVADGYRDLGSRLLDARTTAVA